MARRTKESILDKQRLAYHKTISGSAPCRKCKKLFVIGDVIISKQSGVTGSKYYHRNCWDSLFHQFSISVIVRNNYENGLQILR